MMGKSSHCSYVLQQLYNQREWGFLCDCCISINDIYFQAHKAVLAACSSYFKMMFINHQHTMAQINLTNTKISSECFDLILQFMYLGKIMTAPENFEQLKQAMTYLQLYVIPDCLEDIQDIDSSIKCSSSASSSLSSKMVFGVRMYEEPAAKTPEEPGKLTSEPALPANPNPAQEKQTENNAPHHSRQQTRNVCKKMPSPKVPHSRERGARRFGRSYTCEDCGFVFSCEKLLDEHSQTCTNRHIFQSREQSSNEQSQSGSESPISKFSPPHKADSSQPAEESLASESAKDSGVSSDQVKNSLIDSTEKTPVIIKIESDENSLVEMEDINIVKISEKDYLESSDIDDLDDEAEEGAYYIGIPYNQRMNDKIGVGSQPIFANCSKDLGRGSRKASNADESVPDMSCELCGLTINEQDLSSHYLAKHIENICACGKCGQILVKGRQLQEHAQRCGEPPENFEEDQESNMEERMHFEDGIEESPAVGEVLVDMWDELNEGNVGMPKQVYKYSSCPYRCPNCGQRFESERQVVEHMSQCMEREVYRNSVSDDNDRDHRRKHFCDICGKGFYQRCHLREHYTVHTKEKQFSCQTCGKQFLRERQLRLHNDMHTGMARYVCSLCDQGNFRKHDHVRHMISHLAAGETICQVCFQIFSTNDLLEQHMDIHLYTCGVCGAKFNLRKDMRAHYNAKHFKKA
ncbi:zinc finger and BTB domain-containing protein 1 [Hyperolius riggenbachi]|uniref:zinc finger and BTB domain-containing protein 1 n=1 Tax=Hyperolius riggenbachi TaxID=752182 RepID=UPI0035A38766